MGLGTFDQPGKDRGRGSGGGAVEPVDKGGFRAHRLKLHLLQNGQEPAAEIGRVKIFFIQTNHGILLKGLLLGKQHHLDEGGPGPGKLLFGPIAPDGLK